MIVSHKHRFIFLKTKKTASTAIEVALSALCGPDDIITPFRASSEKHRRGRGPQNYRIEHPEKPARPLLRRLLRRPERYYHLSVGYYEHMPAWRVRTYVGAEVWRSYFKFAFERNPWDRQVSWYLYKTKSKSHRQEFDRFMRVKRLAFIDNHEIYMIDSKLAVDFLGRYEDLPTDINTALAMAGLKQQVEIPKVNVTSGRDRSEHYHDYYTPELRAVIADWYAPEINLLGYKF